MNWGGKDWGVITARIRESVDLIRKYRGMSIGNFPN